MVGSFTLDLQKFVAKAGARADAAVGEVVRALALKVDERSPVGDPIYWKGPAPKGYVGGHFRGNWQLGIGALPAGIVPGVDPDGGRTRAEIAAAIPEQAAGNVYYLANNVPYALRIEHGWSRQAPAGVVGITVTEFDTRISEAVAKAKAVHP